MTPCPYCEQRFKLGELLQHLQTCYANPNKSAPKAQEVAPSNERT